MSNQKTDNAGVIAFPPAIYAGTLAIGFILQFIFPISFVPANFTLFTISFGIILLAAAGLISVSAFRLMSRAKTGINPSLPATTIVTEGAFKFTRNPLYLSLTFLYLAAMLFSHSFWLLLLLFPLLIIINNGVIKREERYLENKFGEEYLRYKSSVRRWL